MSVNVKRFALRELTRAKHEALDASVGNLSDGKSYLRYLMGIAAFRGAVESPLRGISFPETFGAWRPTLIGGELADDLRDLGLPSPDACPAFEMPGDISGMLGVFYVLEGSSLGARLLARQAATLGFDANNGARHLAAQTAQPDSWPRFQALLETATDFDPNAAALSAGRTFDAALYAFSKADISERAG